MLGSSLLVLVPAVAIGIMVQFRQNGSGLPCNPSILLLFSAGKAHYAHTVVLIGGQQGLDGRIGCLHHLLRPGRQSTIRLFHGTGGIQHKDHVHGNLLLRGQSQHLCRLGHRDQEIVFARGEGLAVHRDAGVADGLAHSHLTGVVGIAAIDRLVPIQRAGVSDRCRLAAHRIGRRSQRTMREGSERQDDGQTEGQHPVCGRNESCVSPHKNHHSFILDFTRLPGNIGSTAVIFSFWNRGLAGQSSTPILI